MLKLQYERFCCEYIIDHKGGEAAIRANYAESSAHVQATRLLAKPEIRARIQELEDEITDKLKLTKQQVLDELRKVGFSDIRKLFRKGSRSLEDIQDLDDHTAAAIESIEVVSSKSTGEDVEYTHKIKFSSKLGALKELGKHFNIYEDHQKSGTGEIHVHIEGKDAGL